MISTSPQHASIQQLSRLRFTSICFVNGPQWHVVLNALDPRYCLGQELSIEAEVINPEGCEKTEVFCGAMPSEAPISIRNLYRVLEERESRSDRQDW